MMFLIPPSRYNGRVLGTVTRWQNRRLFTSDTPCWTRRSLFLSPLLLGRFSQAFKGADSTEFTLRPSRSRDAAATVAVTPIPWDPPPGGGAGGAGESLFLLFLILTLFSSPFHTAWTADRISPRLLRALGFSPCRPKLVGRSLLFLGWAFQLSTLAVYMSTATIAERSQEVNDSRVSGESQPDAVRERNPPLLRKLGEFS